MGPAAVADGEEKEEEEEVGEARVGIVCMARKLRSATTLAAGGKAGTGAGAGNGGKRKVSWLADV